MHVSELKRRRRLMGGWAGWGGGGGWGCAGGGKVGKVNNKVGLCVSTLGGVVSPGSRGSGGGSGGCTWGEGEGGCEDEACPLQTTLQKVRAGNPLSPVP